MIGLDGLEPTIVEAMLAAGELPNLAKLTERQGRARARVATTYPAQTPVAWSTFATGTNPGGHGIFDFLRRDPQTYLPDSGLNRYEQKNVVPAAEGREPPARDADLGAALGRGDRLDRPPLPVHLSAGPDPRPDALGHGRPRPPRRVRHLDVLQHGRTSPLTARESENARAGCGPTDGTIATHLIGPRHPRTRADARFEITLVLDPSERRLTVRSDGSPTELEVREGRVERLAAGQVQARAAPVGPRDGAVPPGRGSSRTLELYASPVNFDPDAPLFPISAPPEYAGELAERHRDRSTPPGWSRTTPA